MSVTETILYSYPDQLLGEVWVDWSEKFFASQPRDQFAAPTGFQEMIGHNYNSDVDVGQGSNDTATVNSNSRSRALECYKIGLLRGPVVNLKGAPRTQIPLGWQYIINNEHVHTRLGYCAYILGKAKIANKTNDRIEKAFSALCAIISIQLGVKHAGKRILYPALFEKLKILYPNNNGLDENIWLRYLAAGMFSTLKSEASDGLLTSYIDNTPFNLLKLTWEDGTQFELSPSEFGQFLSDKPKPLTDIKPRKHWLFWLGTEPLFRGVYNKASEHFRTFFTEIAEIEWSAHTNNQENPLGIFLEKDPAHETPCAFQELSRVGSLNPRYLSTINNVMKSIYDGIQEALLFLQNSDTTSTVANANDYNEIYYGAPGTGKSHKIEEIIKNLPETQKERVTFHPEYDHAAFVGSYRPISEVGDDGKSHIKYKFYPQAFTNIYVRAWSDPNRDQKYYLVIEEINRGNCAEIFGDLFQLLDRGSNYSITPSKEMKDYIQNELGQEHEGIKGGKLKLPSNLYLLATMNTSDQALLPMDSAFKRRWTWKFVPINYERNVELNRSAGFIVKLDDNSYFYWLDFIEAVNKKFIKTNPHLGDDKCIGNYFVNPSSSEINLEHFVNKVIFYLWVDVFKDEEETPFELGVSFEDFFPVNSNGLERIRSLCNTLDIPILHE